jgi:Outer membrane protein beta-barrel domain
MKKALMIMLTAACIQAGFAQDDSTKTAQESDTIRVGSIIIIKKGGDKSEYDVYKDKDNYKRKYHRKSNITTNWLIFDIGYSGFNDRTDYGGAEAQAFLQNPNGTPLNSGDFSIRGSRISNFNLWLFMQKLNLHKHVINLKYGFGIENTNFFYKTPLTYIDGGTVYVKRDDVTFSKNKIAADYFTAPLMLNFSTNPDRKNGGLQVSIGVSGGILYSARQKQESNERGKQKQKTDFNLDRWKAAWVAELGLGPVKLYGSYSINTLHKYGVEQYPWLAGIRFSTF